MHVLSPRPRDERGFTLLEVLVAAGILIVAIVGSIALIIGLLKGNQTTRARDTAYFLAQDALDQLASVPLSQVSYLPANVPAGADTFPTAYIEGDDAFIDRPICAGNGPNACVAGTTPAAYWVRSWLCCATPLGGPITGGGLFEAPNKAPVGGPPNACTAAYQWQTSFQTVGPPVGTVPATSATCAFAVEVTWPSEPAGVDLFSDPFTNPLTFQNHVLLSMVRSQ